MPHQYALEMCNLSWTTPLLEKDNSKNNPVYTSLSAHSSVYTYIRIYTYSSFQGLFEDTNHSMAGEAAQKSDDV